MSRKEGSKNGTDGRKEEEESGEGSKFRGGTGRKGGRERKKGVQRREGRGFEGNIGNKGREGF
jgi:hypothetical protein